MSRREQRIQELQDARARIDVQLRRLGVGPRPVPAPVTYADQDWQGAAREVLAVLQTTHVTHLTRDIDYGDTPAVQADRRAVLEAARVRKRAS